MKNREIISNSFKAAFPKSIPILAGYSFLGMTYGILMNVSGFSFLYPLLMSIFIFAGSGQFLAVSILLAPFDPMSALIMTLMVAARHIFYGISMLEKFSDIDFKKKIYLIFGMVDETFSINYTAEIPENCDKGWFMFFVTLLNHIYWITASTLGGIFGSMIKFSTEGLDFVLVAMFVVIFFDNFLKEKNHTSSVLGIVLSVICLLIFGPDNFMIPAMIAILVSLTVLRKPLEKAGVDR